MYLEITEAIFTRLLLITAFLAFAIVALGWAINIVRKGETIKLKWPYVHLKLLEEIGISQKK